MGKGTSRSVGLWIVLVLCLLVFGYVVMLLVLNAPRADVNFRLYPWQDTVPGYWIVVVLLAVGILIVPCVRHLYRAIKGLRVERSSSAGGEKTERAGRP